MFATGALKVLQDTYLNRQLSLGVTPSVALGNLRRLQLHLVGTRSTILNPLSGL